MRCLFYFILFYFYCLGDFSLFCFSPCLLAWRITLASLFLMHAGERMDKNKNMNQTLLVIITLSLFFFFF